MAEVFLGSVYASLEMRDKGFKQATDSAKSELDSLGTKGQVRMASLGQTFQNAGARLSIGLTAPLVLFGKTAFTAAADFDQAMRNVNAVLGLNEKQFQQMKRDIIDFGNTSRSSALDIANSLEYVARSGYRGADALNVMKIASRAAGAVGADTTEVARGLVAVLKSYGMTVKDAQLVTDQLAYATTIGGGTMQELSAELANVVGSSAALKVPFQDVISAMSLMHANGMSTAQASISLNNIFTKLMKPSEALSGYLEKLGYESGTAAIKGMGLAGLMKQLTIDTKGSKDEVANMFNNIQGLRGVFALTKGTGDELADTIKNVGANANGAVEKLRVEQYKSFESNLKRLNNALSAFKIALGNELIPILTKLVELILPIARAFTTLPAPIKQVIIVIGILTAALGPVLFYLGLLLPALAAIGMSFGTFLGIIAGVGLAIGLLITFGKDLGNIFKFLSDTFSIFGQIIGEALAVPLRRLKDLFGQLQLALLQLKPLLDLLIPVLKIIGMVIGVILVTALTLFISLVTGLIAAFIQIVTGIVQFFTGIIQTVTGFFQMIIGLFTGNQELIKTGWNAFTTGLYNILVGFIKVAIAGFKAFIEAIINFFNFLYQNVKETADAILFGVTLVFQTLWSIVVGVVTAMVNAVVSWFNNLWGSVSAIVANIKNWVVGRFTEAKNALVGIGNGIFHAIFDPIQNLWNKVVEFVNKIKDKLQEISPFHRESPSLVDLVTKGVAVIKNQYESLDGINMPSMNDLAFSPASIDVIKDSSPISNNSYVTNSPSFNVSIGMYAGSEMEKRAIAKELNNALLDYQKGTGEGVIS